MHGEQLEIDIHGRNIGALAWGDPDGYPLLALHGWLDNAASMVRLAEHLDGVRLISLDLPGHGYSYHRNGTYYQIWDDLLDINDIADQLGWSRFSFLAHSRGAIVATLFAAAQPQLVESMVLLDGFLPASVEIKDTASQLQKHIEEAQALHHKQPPLYPDIDTAVKARCQASDMSAVAARPVIERGLRQTAKGYVWRSDPALRIESPVKFTREHARVILQSVQAPVLLLLASEALAKIPEVLAEVKHFSDVHMQVVEGGHFFHLEEQAEKVAYDINSFLAKK